MKFIAKSAIASLTCVVLLAGCGSNAINNAPKTPAVSAQKPLCLKRLKSTPKIVQSAVLRLGTYQKWAKVRRIEGDVIITDFTSPAARVIDTYKYRLVLKADQQGDFIRAVETVSNAPAIIETKAIQFVTPKMFAGSALHQAADRFALIAKQLTGALNLVANNPPRNSATRIKIHGKIYIRVPANDSTKGAYYFEPKSKQLAYLTAGADKPGEPGFITAFEYPENATGKITPSKMTVYKIGKRVLVGTEKVFEADFQGMPKFFSTVK